MEYRHLLPDEFEELIDGDLGEDAAALRAHLDSCTECRAEYATRSELAQALERLPHHGPAPLFGYRVMSQVQVFEPWHVALRDFVRRLVPASPAARWMAGAGALAMAMVLTIGGVWAALNTESAWFFADVGVKRARAAVLGGIRGLAESALGRDALGVIEAYGTAGAAVAVTAIVLLAIVAAIGFRGVAVASRRRRS